MGTHVINSTRHLISKFFLPFRGKGSKEGEGVGRGRGVGRGEAGLMFRVITM